MRWAVLVAAVLFALSPLASNGFNGFEPSQFPFPERWPPIQPVGWAFSIWGVIYAWLIIGAAYGAWQRRASSWWDSAQRPLLISLAIGIFWIAVANAAPSLATVMILVMAGTAIAALLRAQPADAWPARHDAHDWTWLAGPIGLYAGWLTAASAVATAVIFAANGWLPPLAAGMLALLIALGVAIWVLRQRPFALSYAFGVGWALMGMIVAHYDVWPTLVVAALGLAAVIAIPLMSRRRAG